VCVKDCQLSLIERNVTVSDIIFILFYFIVVQHLQLANSATFAKSMGEHKSFVVKFIHKLTAKRDVNMCVCVCVCVYVRGRRSSNRQQRAGCRLGHNVKHRHCTQEQHTIKGWLNPHTHTKSQFYTHTRTHGSKMESTCAYQRIKQ